jgi:hypothetical protein
MINVTNGPSDAHKKNPLKRKSWKKITENLMEKTLDMVKKKVQDSLKIFQDMKNKEHEKVQKK